MTEHDNAPPMRARLSRTAEAVDEQGGKLSLEERVLEQQTKSPLDGATIWSPVATVLFTVGGASLRPTNKQDVFKAWGTNGEFITVTKWSEKLG